jgi:hypothetical protein
MTDEEKLADLDEALACLSAERKMLEIKAKAESGLLSVDAAYAKLRLKRIAKESAKLQEERDRLESERKSYWDSVLGKRST